MLKKAIYKIMYKDMSGPENCDLMALSSRYYRCQFVSIWKANLCSSGTEAY